jgi:hypothetical protein
MIRWKNFGAVHVEALRVVLSMMVMLTWKVELPAGDGFDV